MPFWRLYYHLVWSTKNREPLIDENLAKTGEIAQLNRSMPHSGDEKTLVRIIVHQVCGMLRFARSFL